MTVPAPTRSAGRPRDAAADEAILQTTIRLLLEQGYDAMSIEGVAAAAGVGKTTIYRRYPSKRELVIGAISSLAASVEPPEDSGNTRDDLFEFIRGTFGVMRRGGLGYSMIGTLLVRERDDPALLELFRQQVLRPRIGIATAILRRGVERGELRPDIPLEITAQMIAGAIFARHIVGQSEDDAWLATAFDTLWRGVAVSTPATGR
jgi:AcrR family transcriptional regulator